MSSSLNICRIPDDVLAKLKKFRFQKNEYTSAIILKIVKDTQEVNIEEELDDCTIDDLRSQLPDRNPRFVLISYKIQHSDGRLSFPLCLVFSSPLGCSPELQMLYAGSKNNLAKEANVGKEFEIRDIDDLTDEFLLEKLGVCVSKGTVFSLPDILPLQLPFKCGYCTVSFVLSAALRVHKLANHTESYVKDLLASPKKHSYYPVVTSPTPVEESTTATKQVENSTTTAVVALNEKIIKREEVEPPPADPIFSGKRVVVIKEKENLKPDLSEMGTLKSIITMDNLNSQTSEFKKLYLIDKFAGERSSARVSSTTPSRLVSISHQRSTPYSRKLDETVVIPRSSAKRVDTVVSNSAKKIRKRYDTIRSAVSAISSTQRNERRCFDSRSLERKKHRVENTPYCALLVHGLKHLMKITIYYNNGTEDLLKNVTFKATKLCRQCSPQTSLSLTCCNKPVIKDAPKFAFRNFRFSYDRQSRSFNAASPEVFWDEKHGHFARLKRRAIKYDLKIDRMQKQYIDDLAVQNVFHLYCLSSWAGESGATKSQIFELLYQKNEKKPNENDLCVKALLNCYNNRR